MKSKISPASSIFFLTVEFFERVPATFPFVPVACQSAPMESPAARGARKTLDRSPRVLPRKSDRRLDGHHGVRLIASESIGDGSIQRMSAMHKTLPANLILDDFTLKQVSEFRTPVYNFEENLLFFVIN